MKKELNVKVSVYIEKEKRIVPLEELSQEQRNALANKVNLVWTEAMTGQRYTVEQVG